MEKSYEIKRKMRSVGEIRKLTRAMQLVSASKTQRSRAQLDKTLPFFSVCARSMLDILDSNHEIDDPFFTLPEKRSGETWHIGYFVLTGNQGLAGAYNQNVIEATQAHIQAKVIDNISKNMQTQIKLFVFGKTGKDVFINNGLSVDEDFSYPITQPTYYEARTVADLISDKVRSGELDLIYLIYTMIRRGSMMEPVISRLLPVNKGALDMVPPSKASESIVALRKGVALNYHPGPDAVFSFLIDTYLNAMIYGALVEAFASEQTARMIAMENATQSADDMLSNLGLRANIVRQSTITNELIEMQNTADLIGRGTDV